VLERLVGTILIVVLLVGVVALVLNNLNTRFDEFARPTGTQPLPPTWLVGVVVTLMLLLGGAIAIAKGEIGGDNKRISK